VRALAPLHGGEAAVDSPGLGRGSTFSIHLPIATGAISEVEPAPEAAAPPFVARHILIVEDGADNREALAELLITCGHRVDEAMDGEQGIERALAVRPEVALVDIGLPRADGYEVARQIRAALGSAISLIALTGYGQPDDRARALAAGFDPT
jgi:CheY-like chemotaxis protein